MKMRNLLVIIIAVAALLGSSAVYSRDNNRLPRSERRELRKAEKQRQKREQAAADSIAYLMACNAVEQGRFVVTADQISGRYGRVVNVNESTNFVLVQGDTAIVQFALERGFAGPNGLGGITVQGRVTKTDIKYKDNGDLVYSMFVTGMAISADVYFILTKGSTACNVTVNSNYTANRLTFRGELHPYNARIFQGYTIK